MANDCKYLLNGMSVSHNMNKVVSCVIEIVLK